MSLLPGEPTSIPVTFLLFNVRTDPDTITCLVTDPVGGSTLYTFGVDAEVVKNAIGEYQTNIVIPAPATSIGTWVFEWTGTIVDPAATILQDGEFEVDAPDSVLTVTVSDGAGVVEGAVVTLLTALGIVVDTQTTNSVGVAVFATEPGDYVLRTAKAGSRFPNTSVTVVGATAQVVLGVNLGITTPPTVGLCRLYGFLVSGTGEPIGGESILVMPVGRMGRALVAQGATGVDRENVGVVKDRRQLRSRTSDGYWEVELVVGSLVDVMVPALGWERQFRVPEQDSLNFADVRPDPMQETGGLQGSTPQNI